MPAAIRFSPWSEEGATAVGRRWCWLLRQKRPRVATIAHWRRRDAIRGAEAGCLTVPGNHPCCPWQASNIVDADPSRRREFDQAIARRSSRSSGSTAGAPRAASRSMTSNPRTLIEDADVALRCEHARRSMICLSSSEATSVRGNSRCHSGIGMCRSPSNARPTE
jgi:hypothetical protein